VNSYQVLFFNCYRAEKTKHELLPKAQGGRDSIKSFPNGMKHRFLRIYLERKTKEKDIFNIKRRRNEDRIAITVKAGSNAATWRQKLAADTPN
jgi:hypothetical protein